MSNKLLHSYYYYLFIYLEPSILLFSITTFTFFPQWTSYTLFQPFIEYNNSISKSHIPTLTSNDNILLTHPLTYLLIGMFFNITCIVAGIQYSTLSSLSYRLQQIFIFCLLYGDIIHFYYTFRFIFNHNLYDFLNITSWTMGIHLNLMITFMLMMSRVFWYISGKEYDLSTYTQQHIDTTKNGRRRKMQ